MQNESDVQASCLEIPSAHGAQELTLVDRNVLENVTGFCTQYGT